MHPFNYTIVGSRNCPATMVIGAKSHRIEDDKLILATGDSSEEVFLEPQEWWRQEAVGYVNHLETGASVFEHIDWYLLNEHGQAGYCYTLRSRHSGRKAVVHADSEERDGPVLRLLLKRKVVALFDGPEEIHVKHLRYTDDEL